MKSEATATTLRDEQVEKPLRDQIVRTVASAGGFRLQTLEKSTPEEVARHVGRVPSRRLPHLPLIFRTFLVNAHRGMLSRYLDKLGLPHNNGVFEGELEDDLDKDKATEAVQALLRAYPADIVVVYLAALNDLTPRLVPGVSRLLSRRFAGKERVADESTTTSFDAAVPDPQLIQDAAPSDAEDLAGLPQGPGFSPLDRLLIRGAVDATQGVIGAMDTVVLEDLVDELISLNSHRHRSFFHRGFLDALRERPRAEALPAQNLSRQRWYLAGWVSGMARSRRDDLVLEVVGVPVWQPQGDQESVFARRLVLPIFFDALCRNGREPEAARLTSAPELIEWPQPLMRRLLVEGTRLLREDETERARPFFDRLGEVVRLLEQRGAPTTEPFFLEVRRRRAHCYRQLGHTEQARELLERLLNEDPDPGIRAMVLADLGLLDAGWRSLAEVRLWTSAAERSDFVERLSRGRERFEQSARSDTRLASHGAWPLGILRMAEREYEAARELLSMALSSYLERPDRYSQRGLTAKVKVASGIAEALSLEYARLERAARLLREGLEEGAEFPLVFLEDVLAALASHDSDLDQNLINRLVQAQGDAVLRRIVETSDFPITPAVALHLEDRGQNASLPRSERAKCLRMALPVLLQLPDQEMASAALDTLEGLAHQGYGTEEFIALLRSRTGVDPAWSSEEAQWALVGVYDTMGRYQDAVAVLRDRMTRILAQPTWKTDEEAAAILSHARSYSLGEEWTQDLQERLEAWLAEHAEAEQEEAELILPHPNHVFRVLIVGGDERQNKLEDRVQRALTANGLPIRVSHLPTGWGSNWAPTLKEAVKRSERCDGLVLIRFMRTQFGRSLRARIHRPWVSCPGVGTLQLTRMVKKVATFASRNGA